LANYYLASKGFPCSNYRELAIINTLYDTLTSYIIATAGVLQECKRLPQKIKWACVQCQACENIKLRSIGFFFWFANQAVWITSAG